MLAGASVKFDDQIYDCHGLYQIRNVHLWALQSLEIITIQLITPVGVCLALFMLKSLLELVASLKLKFPNLNCSYTICT